MFMKSGYGNVLCDTRFFYKHCFFSTQPPYCLTFSWIELQMLLRCCLIHISIIRQRRTLYLLHFYPSLDLRPFISYLRDLFFIFIFVFMLINRIISWIHTLFTFRLIRPIIFTWRMWITSQQKFSLRVFLRICIEFLPISKRLTHMLSWRAKNLLSWSKHFL